MRSIPSCETTSCCSKLLHAPAETRSAGETTWSWTKWLELRCVWADRSGTKRTREQRIAKSKLHPGDVTRCVAPDFCYLLCVAFSLCCCKRSVIYCIAGGGRCAFFLKWATQSLFFVCKVDSLNADCGMLTSHLQSTERRIMILDRIVASDRDIRRSAELIGQARRRDRHANEMAFESLVDYGTLENQICACGCRPTLRNF